MIKISNEESTPHVEDGEQTNADDMFLTLEDVLEKQELRVTGIYGDVTEERCSETVYGLLALKDSGRRFVREDPEDEESDLLEYYEPIDFYISSFGGQASEMFAVYDLMRDMSTSMDIVTHGLGKVMSAGVLLLAAGTKGKRRIGANCRVMIHGVVAGQQGNIADMENEFAETKMTQKLYIRSLANETNMDEKFIRKLMSKKTNVYFDAEEAVKLGIADIIF
jgi:ATP-dependent Clp endopeptidase proteolytic subunit ClpP